MNVSTCTPPGRPSRLTVQTVPLLDKGHKLFVDNWLTSVVLFEKLFERSTGACGTIRKDRLSLPEFKAKIGKGQQVYKNTDNMLFYKINAHV